MPRFLPAMLCLEKCCEKEFRLYEAFKPMFERRTGDSSKQDRGNGNEKGFSNLKWLLQSNVHLSSVNCVVLSKWPQGYNQKIGMLPWGIVVICVSVIKITLKNNKYIYCQLKIYRILRLSRF